MMQTHKHILAAAGASLALVSLFAALSFRKDSKKSTKTYDNVLIGDIGGTNIRLQLLRLYYNPDQANQR
jgi:hexokinase